MVDTVYLLAAGYRYDAPFWEWRTERFAKVLENLPGLERVLWLRDKDRINLLMFATEQHAWKAQSALQYRSFSIGRMTLKILNRWSVGKRVFIGELDLDAEELRVMKPAEGWDSFQEEDRPNGLPWPPPDGKPIDVIKIQVGGPQTAAKSTGIEA